MKAEVLFQIPDQIAGKLATGELERVGGVVREQATGKVVMWLRETIPSPVDSRRFPASGLNQLLSIGGHAASILNLGATVAFGMATLAKLSRIEGKLGVMDAKLDELVQRAQRLEWTVELGFANTLAALASINQHHEIELIGDLNSAATLAWSSQFLEPCSQQRISRIENALHTASNVKEKLLIHARQEMQAAAQEIRNKRKSYYGFAFDESVIKGLLRLRQAITASSLCASICVEADSMYAASSMLVKEHQLFKNLFIDVAGGSLNSQEAVYRTLLGPSFSDFMPALRVDSWARKYDKKGGGVFDVLDAFRSITKPSIPSSSIANSVIWSRSGLNIPGLSSIDDEKMRQQTSLASAITFIDLIDGIDLDLDRLLGYQAEFKEGSIRSLSIQEYRDALRIDEVAEVDSLVCFLSLNEAV